MSITTETQSIFDILNFSNVKWRPPPNEPYRYYACESVAGYQLCKQIKPNQIQQPSFSLLPVNSTFVSIRSGCPEMFDAFTLSYKLRSPVAIAKEQN